MKILLNRTLRGRIIVGNRMMEDHSYYPDERLSNASIVFFTPEKRVEGEAILYEIKKDADMFSFLIPRVGELAKGNVAVIKLMLNELKKENDTIS